MLCFIGELGVNQIKKESGEGWGFFSLENQYMLKYSNKEKLYFIWEVLVEIKV